MHLKTPPAWLWRVVGSGIGEDWERRERGRGEGQSVCGEGRGEERRERGRVCEGRWVKEGGYEPPKGLLVEGRER